MAPAWASRTLLAASALGIAFSAASSYVHYQLTSSAGGYVSFCNLSSTVNCDTVVTSEYGSLFGVPVAVWGLLFYAALFARGLRTTRGSAFESDRARADVLALAAAGSLFSLYLAFVSLTVLGAVCLLCVGLYAASALALLSAWRLGTPLATTTANLRDRWRNVRRRPALASAAAIAVAGMLILPTWLGAPTRMSREQVFRANPKFYDWYVGLPIVDLKPEGGVAQGSDQAPITLIEFSDFQCPHCARAHVTLKDLLSRYREDVRFVFFHFPMSKDCNRAVQVTGHDRACGAAVAADCAKAQDKFPAYVNLLFANQNDLGPESLKRYAEEAGLAGDAFGRCVEDATVAAGVRASVDAGLRAGVASTPTFFINGRKVEGNMSYENWVMALAVELDKRGPS